jgi:hypothetical protein
LISADPPQAATCAQILAALEQAGWQIDEVWDDRVEASDGDRYGIGIFFEQAVPVEICYGDGEQDLQ